MGEEGTDDEDAIDFEFCGLREDFLVVGEGLFSEVVHVAKDGEAESFMFSARGEGTEGGEHGSGACVVRVVDEGCIVVFECGDIAASFFYGEESERACSDVERLSENIVDDEGGKGGISPVESMGG